MKPQTKFISITFPIMIMLAIVFQICENTRGRRLFQLFDTTEIAGIVEYVGIKHHGNSLKINSLNEEFVFYPFTGPLNDYNIFDHKAKKGDSVYKAKYSDFLKLISNGKLYVYTFKRIE